MTGGHDIKALKDVLWKPESGLLGAVDTAFGEMVVRRAQEKDEDAQLSYAQLSYALLAALTLRAFQDGHSCLDVEKWCELHRNDVPETQRAALDAWASWAKSDAPSGAPGLAGSDGDASAPLIVYRGRFYLNRMRSYERCVVRKLQELEAAPLLETSATPEKIRSCHEHFQAKQDSKEDAQQEAVWNAVRSRLTIVTGGPGTGKTTVLAVILAWRLLKDPSLSVSLCAPTGKAAKRMKASISDAVGKFQGEIKNEALTARLNSLECLTLHKLLGLRPGRDTPKYHSGNRLPADYIVVDECSMMSLQQFAQLLSAMKEGASLLLLGDKDQLPSVDAGSVMAEIAGMYSKDGVASAEKPPVVTRLTENYRSKDNPELCEWVAAMAEDKQTAEELFDLFTRKQGDGMRLVTVSGGESGRGSKEEALKTELDGAIEAVHRLKNAWQALKRAKANPDCEAVKHAYAVTESFKVLCAVREGAFGVLTLNRLMREVLSIGQAEYANGVPVMVTKNDPVTGLKNGDTGVCLGGQVWFPGDAEGTFRSFSAAELPPHEPAFAMTIHKSQGSGYDHVFVVLPEDRENRVLTRELVYTGVTRTKKTLTLVSPAEVLKAAIDRRTARWSGIAGTEQGSLGDKEPQRTRIDTDRHG